MTTNLFSPADEQTIVNEPASNIHSTLGGVDPFVAQADEPTYSDTPEGKILAEVSRTITDYSASMAKLNRDINSDDITTKHFDLQVTALREQTVPPVEKQLRSVFYDLYGQLETNRDSLRNTPQFDIEPSAVVAQRAMMLAQSGNVTLMTQKFADSSDEQRVAFAQVFDMVEAPKTNRGGRQGEYRILRDQVASFASKHKNSKLDGLHAIRDGITSNLEACWQLSTFSAPILRSKTGVTVNHSAFGNSGNQPLDKLVSEVSRQNPLDWHQAVVVDNQWSYDYGTAKSTRTPGVLGGGSVPETTSIPADI